MTYTYGDSAWGDLLTAYDGSAITYDAIGNPLSDGTWNYTWEHGRQLAGMSNGSTTWDYTYDANGLRTSRSNGATTYTYVYDGTQLSQVDGAGKHLRFTYDANGLPMTVYYNDTTYYYVLNAQGDVTAILNRKGEAIVQYTYDAWGNTLSVTGSWANSLGKYNPLRYRGYVYDHETGLYYLQSRYYNPKVGRFINADALASTGQGILGNNMFAYCQNNPVNFVDICGKISSRIDLVCLNVGGGTSGEKMEPDYPSEGEGNYYTFSKKDLYFETVSVYQVNSKDEIFSWYEQITANDFEAQNIMIPGLPDWASLVLTLLGIYSEKKNPTEVDPKGRVIYITEGYSIAVLSRVYIGKEYSAAEDEFFVYDNNHQLVFNRTVRISYFTD